MAATAAAISEDRTGGWFGHPRGLFILFFTEMWERFSYYGMRSLLVLYMVNFLFIHPEVGRRVLGFNAIKGILESAYGPLAAQPLSSQIYGLYTALVYLTPFFGGMLADRVLGQRKSVIFGGVLMAIGEFMLMSEHLFFPALICLIVGNGAFKPNISTQVGDLYAEGDRRRDSAFTIFYMGINLGAFFSPIVCGTLGQTVGWKYGFGAAGVGMVLGVLLYGWGQHILGREAESGRKPLTSGRAMTAIVCYIGATVIGVLLLVSMFLLPETLRLGIGVLVLVGIIVWIARLPRDERPRVIALLVLCALNVVFWAVYEQQGNTMQLWADQNTNWKFLGITIPSTWYQAFNPAMIFIFAPILSWFWAIQAKRKQEPSTVSKMGIGALLVGFSFVVMILAARGLSPNAQRSVLWLVGMTAVITLGELYLSPVGLSFVTKVAPARMVSMLMGVWFLANFFGNYLSGYLGTFWEKMPHGRFFFLLMGLGVGTGILIFLFNRPLSSAVGSHDRPSA